MILDLRYPPQEIICLIVGDLFEGEKIVRLSEMRCYLKIETAQGTVFTVRSKPGGCTVHKRTEPTKFDRFHARRKFEHAEQRRIAEQERNKEE
jgi:hypothetical protein